MKTKLSINSIQKAIACALIAGASLASSANAQVLFSEDFEGGTGAVLDGTAEDTSGALWASNGFATDNGILNVGPDNFEGAATLAVSLELDSVYTVSMDVTTAAAEWFGLGYSENPPMINPDTGVPFLNRPQDRFAQSGGRACFLLRPRDPLAIQVEIFGGGTPGTGTANPIADIGTNFSGPAQLRTLSVVLDTASAGFTADFLIDGVSQSSGFQALFEDSAAMIPLTDVSLLANVGFTWEGQSAGGASGPITVDNFEFSVVGSGLPGDVNCDGTVDLLDVAPFVDLILSGGFEAKADLNGDDVVDLLDVAPFVALLLG